jgi:Enterobacter phage Enc34, ssDNA-binding protein
MSEQKTAQAGLYTLTSPVVMAFPNLFKPRAFTKSSKEEPKYDGQFLFEANHPDLSAIKKLLAQVASARWPGRDLKTVKFPLARGDKRADDAEAKGKDLEFMRGKFVLSARSQYAPKLAAVENGELVEYLDEALRATAASKFFSGVEVLAQFNFRSYEGVGANPEGVTAYLQMVLSLNRGDRLGGGSSAAEVFSSYVGHLSAVDPYAHNEALDNEIPF